MILPLKVIIRETLNIEQTPIFDWVSPDIWLSCVVLSAIFLGSLSFVKFFDFVYLTSSDYGWKSDKYINIRHDII